MQYTSSEANKLLRRLHEERDALIEREKKSSIFLAAMGEDPESVRPAYDFSAVQKTLDELDQKIRIVKHAINRFNLEHTVDGFAMTVDQILVYIPQLTAKKQKLGQMKNRLPKQREMPHTFSRGNIIDYSYANYDISLVQAEYETVTDELARAQTALDVLNNTKTMEIAI